MKRFGILFFLALPSWAGIVYSSNFNANTVTAYDSTTGASLGTVISGNAVVEGYNGIRVGPNGDIYLVGQLSNSVARFDSTGTLIDVLDPAGLDSPQGLNFGLGGSLYVVSAANDKVVRYDPSTGAYLGDFATLGTSGHDGPIDIVFGGGYAYISAFDSGRLVKVDAATGLEVDSFPAPPGFALTTLAMGPDGNIYSGTLNFADFSGSVLQFTPAGVTTEFVATGSGGLYSPGGIAFAPNGDLLVTNLLFDPNTFTDTGSTILRYNGQTGAFVGELVGTGQGLDIPFFITVATPEPGTFGLGVTALAVVCAAGIAKRVHVGIAALRRD